MKKIYEEMQNYLILPVFAIFLGVSLSYQKNFLLALLALFFFLRICYLKKNSLLGLFFVGSLLLGIRTFSYLDSFSLTEVPKSQALALRLDSLKISGDYLQVVGENQAQQAFQISYRIKTEQEQQAWKNLPLATNYFVTGDFSPSEPQRNLHSFDQKKYDYSQNIKGRIKASKLVASSQATTKDIHYLRYQLKRRNETNLPQRLATYVNALVLGLRDEDFKQQTAGFEAHGLLHLFALSGLHVQFYLGSVHLLLKFLKLIPQERLPLLIFASLGFGLLTGFSISVVRGILSFLIGFICHSFQVKLSKLDQWSLMFFILLLIFPLALWSVGGQLSLGFSFLLIYLPLLKSESWQQTLCFSLFTIPLLMGAFSQWSALGGVLTFVLMPLFKWLMLPLMTFLFCFGGITPDFVLAALNRLLRSFEKLLLIFKPVAIVLGKPSFYQMFLLMLLLLWLFHQIKIKGRLGPLLIGCLFLIGSCLYPAEGLLAFIDVGQGDSCLIQLPFKQEVFLIDTGGQLPFEKERWQKKPQEPPSNYNLLPVLKGQGIKKIHHLVLTHNDADHLGEIQNILKNFTVENIYIGAGAKADFSQLVKKIPAKTQLQEVQAGAVIGEKLKIQILSPQKTGEGENNDSIVSYFQLAGEKFLLTGDLEKAGEQDLLANYPQLTTDVLKIGHHGSNTSSDPQFVKKIRAKTAVITAGKNNPYGHPTKETLETLENNDVTVFRTDQNGMIFKKWWPLKSGKLRPTIAFPPQS